VYFAFLISFCLSFRNNSDILKFTHVMNEGENVLALRVEGGERKMKLNFLLSFNASGPRKDRLCLQFEKKGTGLLR